MYLNMYNRIWSIQLVMPVLGGEDAQDALSLQVIFRKRAV